jgi:L-ascorbate metabolism protein UlaG (beta-lactamase superfamily)
VGRSRKLARSALAALFALAIAGCSDAPSPSGGPVAFTWLGVSHWLVETPVGSLLLDAYVSRPPFTPHGPTSEGLDLFRRIELATRPPQPIRWIVVGHSHFDHAIDVGVLAESTGARVLGSRTTCFIAEAQGLPVDRCTAVDGGETIALDPRLEVRVVRVPHSSPATIGRFAELGSPPVSATDAPNGGNVAFLFRLFDASGRVATSWFYANSIAPIDSDDGSGVDFAAAMASAFADVEPTDAWLGAPFGGAATLAPYLDAVRPSTFVPHHWDGLTPVLTDGVASSFAAPDIDAELAARGGAMLVPRQYLDRLVLEDGTARIEANDAVKAEVGVPIP